MTIRIGAEKISAARELDIFLERCRGSGAIASFSGLVRGTTRTGEDVQSLIIEQYPEMTRLSIERIADAAATHFDLEQMIIRHRIGTIRPNETIVFVAISSAHRAVAFEACEYVMDHLKSRAIFWKKEMTASGGVWIEPTEDDQSALARWGQRTLQFEDVLEN